MLYNVPLSPRYHDAQIERWLLPTLCLGIAKPINTSSTTTTTIIDDAYHLLTATATLFHHHHHRHHGQWPPPASVVYAHNNHRKNHQHHVTMEGEEWGAGVCRCHVAESDVATKRRTMTLSSFVIVL